MWARGISQGKKLLFHCFEINRKYKSKQNEEFKKTQLAKNIAFCLTKRKRKKCKTNIAEKYF